MGCAPPTPPTLSSRRTPRDGRSGERGSVYVGPDPPCNTPRSTARAAARGAAQRSPPGRARPRAREARRRRRERGGAVAKASRASARLSLSRVHTTGARTSSDRGAMRVAAWPCESGRRRFGESGLFCVLCGATSSVRGVVAGKRAERECDIRLCVVSSFFTLVAHRFCTSSPSSSSASAAAAAATKAGSTANGL